MIFRLRHLTPGYFRLLQMQLASGSELESEDRLVNHLALLLAILGLSLSYYSARQLVEEVKPPSRPLQPSYQTGMTQTTEDGRVEAGIFGIHPVDS